MLLAIDTSAGTAVAVVDREGGVLAERGTADTRSHAERIGPLIAEAMDAAGVAPVALSGVAVGMGPGPFTGLRVGIAAARAYAFGLGRPVVPIASHDAVAHAAARAGSVAPLLVVTDARRREVAWSAYAAPDGLGLPVRLAGPELAVAEGFALPPGLPEGMERVDAAEIPAGALGMLAELLLLHRRPLGPEQPLYLRAPDVTLSAPKRVGA